MQQPPDLSSVGFLALATHARKDGKHAGKSLCDRRAKVDGSNQHDSPAVAYVTRPAGPADAEDVARLLCLSDPKTFDSVYTVGGASAQQFLPFLARSGKGWWGSPSSVTLAARGGKAVGVAVAWAAKDGRRLRRQQRWKVLRFYGLLGAIRIARHMPMYHARVTKRRSFLNRLFVEEEHRGRKVRELLLNHAAKTARERGSKYLVTYVASDNSQAREMLEQMGFQEISEVQAFSKTMKRMTLIL